MKGTPQRVEKYGVKVWSNIEMDEVRKTECLCLNCARMDTNECGIAAMLYSECLQSSIALMVTRCPDWRPKPSREDEIEAEIAAEGWGR